MLNLDNAVRLPPGFCISRSITVTQLLYKGLSTVHLFVSFTLFQLYIKVYNLVSDNTALVWFPNNVIPCGSKNVGIISVIFLYKYLSKNTVYFLLIVANSLSTIHRMKNIKFT